MTVVLHLVLLQPAALTREHLLVFSVLWGPAGPGGWANIGILNDQLRGCRILCGTYSSLRQLMMTTVGMPL